MNSTTRNVAVSDAVELTRALAPGPAGAVAYPAPGTPDQRGPATAGDIVMVSRNTALAEGDLVLARLRDDGLMLGRFLRRRGQMGVATADGPDLRSSFRPASQLHIEGKVVVIIRGATQV
jgi:hypothetical protein